MSYTSYEHWTTCITFELSTSFNSYQLHSLVFRYKDKQEYCHCDKKLVRLTTQASGRCNMWQTGNAPDSGAINKLQ